MNGYRSVIRPLAFALPAEVAHDLAGALLRRPLPWRAIGGAAADPALETSLAGIGLRNPVGMAAGFDKNCRFLDSLGELGFGYVVGGTVTSAPREGNPKPRVTRYPGRRSVVNAMGFPNRGVAAARRELMRLPRTAPRLVSLSDERVDDVLRAHEIVEELVDGVELNVSCPNVGWGRDREGESFLTDALGRLPPRRRKPLLVKIPPYRSSREREGILWLVNICVDAGVDGLTASNTLPVLSAKMAVGRGGLSGKAVFPHTVRIVADLYRATDGAVPINACGGIFTAADALACIRAGATTVQVYTGLIYEGPRIVRSITEGLGRAVAGAPSQISSLVGADA